MGMAGKQSLVLLMLSQAERLSKRNLTLMMQIAKIREAT